MTRRMVGLGYAVWFFAVVGIAACSGNGSNAPPIDAGVPPANQDATLPPSDDATVPPVVDSGDSGEDAGSACRVVDAGRFTDAEVLAGYAIIVAKKCQSCHGQELEGKPNGVPSDDAEGGVAYPPNLTPDPATGIGCWSGGQIKHAFLYGVNPAGQQMCDPMPRFGDEGDAGISEAGADYVVAYLRNIPAIVNPVPENPACPLPPAEDAGSEEDSSAEDAAPEAGHDAAAGDAGDGGDAN